MYSHVLSFAPNPEHNAANDGAGAPPKMVGAVWRKFSRVARAFGYIGRNLADKRDFSVYDRAATSPTSRIPDLVDQPEILAWIRDKLRWPFATLTVSAIPRRKRSSSQCMPALEPCSKRHTDILQKSRAQEDPKLNVLRLVHGWLCDETNGNASVGNGNGTAGGPQARNGSILISSRSKHVVSRLNFNKKKKVLFMVSTAKPLACGMKSCISCGRMEQLLPTGKGAEVMERRETLSYLAPFYRGTSGDFLALHLSINAIFLKTFPSSRKRPIKPYTAVLLGIHLIAATVYCKYHRWFKTSALVSCQIMLSGSGFENRDLVHVADEMRPAVIYYVAKQANGFLGRKDIHGGSVGAEDER
ncbi:uncharacterized protein BDR25DRAFT_357592 [Lindgomyces ingoldianus]|uniref:Uncharacterized protein n=1 Tax=Lindgomyces ingoldianus TaxID=673940 RepID=A0ACB6QPT7_9PLEO|nr:uncharacterized protein BDR25DRAFT_357592 [Lindgomyces ingoldianus]KAF2468297.1 hypothetical protein BDR25DRAFT_357592 [Lindgomyces ingoldianus]